VNHPDFIQAILDADPVDFVPIRFLRQWVAFPFEELSSDRDGLYPLLLVSEHLKEIPEFTACISAGWQDGQPMDVLAEMTSLCRVILGEDGADTIASALTWACYLLAQNPGEQDCMQAESEAVLSGRLPDLGDLEDLSYTRKVLAETMRLYPPVWLVGRQAIRDYPLGMYLIPGGATVLISPWVMHHDARYFPDPSRFEPSRWTSETQETHPRFTCLPFGDARAEGSEELLWTIVLLILATLVKGWRFGSTTSHPVAMQTGGLLRPKRRIYLNVERRENERYCKEEERAL